MKTYFTLLLLLLLNTTHLFGQSAYSKLCYEGVQKEKNGDLVGAKIIYTQAIGMKPQETMAFLFRGKVSFRLGEYDNSIADLTFVISLEPKNTNALNVRSQAYLKKDELEKAINDQSTLLTIVTKKDALYSATLIRRANTYFSLKKFTESAADYTTYINSALLNSQFIETEVYKKRALCYFKLEKYADAITDLQAFNATNNSSLQSHYMIGLAYYQLKDLENAKKSAEKLFEIDPSKRIVYSGDKILKLYDYESNKAQINFELEEIKAKLKEVNTIPSINLQQIELLDLYTRTKSIWSKHVMVYEEDIKFRDSLKVFIKSIYANLLEKPTIDEEARKLIVQANNATNETNYEKSILLYANSLLIEPCNHLAYYNLSLLYARKDNYENAIHNMREYIFLNPNASDKRAAQDKIYEWEGKLNSTKKEESVDPELVNYMKDNKADDAFFILSYGIKNPLGFASKFNPYETMEDRLFRSGKLGIKPGYYLEIGGGGGNFSNKKRVGYFIHGYARYHQNEIDWRSAGDVFSADSKKHYLRYIEFSEKIGMWLRPANNTFIELSWMPSILMLFDVEYNLENSTMWQHRSFGPVNPRASQTLGATLRYRFLAVSYEWSFVPFKFSTYNYYLDKLTNIETTSRETGKTKIKYSTIRLSLYF